MAESSAGSSFDCPICSDSFKVNDDLVDHLCEHLSYRKYRCGSCEKTFISERKQKKHCEKKSHFRIHQPSINLYNELLLEQFQEELAFLRGGGNMDRLIAFKQNSLWKLQNVRRDLPSHGRTEVPVLFTSANSAQEKHVMSSTPQDANRVVHKKTTSSRTIQSARSIMKTESIARPPSGFTNNVTMAANPTTPSSRSRGTTWYAQPKPMPLGSSDSESDDDDSSTQNTQSREVVAQRKVFPSANSSAVSKSNVHGNAKEKGVMSSSPQDANREIVQKKTATSRTIQSARSIVKTESIAIPPSGFTNNTTSANPTTSSSRSRGTTWYAQPKPIPLGSSDSEFDDDSSSTQNMLSREAVAQRKVTLSANSSAMSFGVNKKISISGAERNTQPMSKSAATTNRSSALVNNSRKNALTPIRCGATSDAQLQPITLGSSDSDSDENADQIITRREDVLHCSVDTSDEENTCDEVNTTSGSSSKRNASVESRKLAVVRCASDSDDDGNVRSSGSTTERVRKEAIEGAPPRKRTHGKSMYGEGQEFSMVTLSGSKRSSVSWMFKPFADVTCEICHSDGPSDYVSRRKHVSSFHLENNDLTLKRYWHLLEAQMQKAYPGMTYSDLQCKYPGCPEKEYYSQNYRRIHVMRNHSPCDLCCVIDECSFLSTNAPEMELHLKNEHELPNGSKSLSPLLAAAVVRERRSKNSQLDLMVEFCFPGAIPLHLASQTEFNEFLGVRADFDLLQASFSTIFCGTLQRKDCNDDEVSSRDSESSTRKRTQTTSCCSANGGCGTTSEIAVDPTISSLNWVLFFQSSKVKCQFCNHEGSGDYVYRKYHVASKHMNQCNLRDTDYYDVLQAKMLEAYPSMTFSDMQCQYPGCGKIYTRQDSRSTHVWNQHGLEDMRCIFRECAFSSSFIPKMEEHLKVTHNHPNGWKSLGMLEAVAFVSVRRRKMRQVAAMVECCFPCPVPLHASKAALKQLMIDGLGRNALQDDEREMVITTTPNSSKPVKCLKRRRANPSEFTDQFTVVERLPLAMRTITPEDRARMMKFAPMRRRWPSSSESESDDEEETTETAQGVVTNNDVDGNVVKASGTAAKVSKIEISSSDGSDL